MKSTRCLAVSLVTLLALALQFSPSSLAQVVRQVTDEKTTVSGPGALDDSGTAVWAGASSDSAGTNPEHAFQVLRFDPVTGVATQITNAAEGMTPILSVSDDGAWLAFASPADLTGANHDQSIELFVMSSDGAQITQLTDDPAPNAGSVGGAVLSGDGEKIAFVANTDPLGTNPDQKDQLFVIDRDGTDLAQLTNLTTESLGSVSISDDGTRIVFASDGELFAILADGTGLRQLTVTPEGFSTGSPVLSGDGGTVAFQSDADLAGTNPDNQTEIFALAWDGTALRQVTTTRQLIGLTGDPVSQSPSITDDGSTIFYHSNHSVLFPPLNIDGNYEIFRIGSNGTGMVALTGSLLDVGSLLPIASGDGSRVVYYDIDTNVSLRVMQGDGAAELDLMVFDIISNDAPDLTPDGTRVVFVRSEGLFATGQIWRFETGGGDPVQVTSLTSGSPSSPSVAGDRETIVFAYDGDPVATNVDGSKEIFRVQADGTGLAQLTDGPADTSSENPVIAADGSVVAFDSDADLTGGNPDLSREIFVVGADGTGLQQLTSGILETVSRLPRVDATGTWVVFESNADLDGGNPDGTYEVYRVRSDGTGLERITGDPVASSRGPDVSGDGTRIVFGSDGDPLGTNPELNPEVYLYDTTGPVLSQLTTFDEGSSGSPRISGDGTWIYFASSAPVFEYDPDEPGDIYRIPAAGGTIERVGARRAGFSLGFGGVSLAGGGALETDDSGDVSVFSGFGDLTAGNKDLLSEVWIIDREEAPAFDVSPESPTLLSWTYNSGPVRYDVIRGDVAFLADGAGTVDLGPVTCIEDDSPDADTLGFEDPEVPASGQVLFYLYRGSQGQLDGPGSYGTSSDGRERVAGAGDCAESW